MHNTPYHLLSPPIDNRIKPDYKSSTCTSESHSHPLGTPGEWSEPRDFKRY